MVLADEACATSPHDLRGLLAALGLPIASARLPRHVERSILAHTPSAVPLTPALVRTHLSSSSASSSSSSSSASSRGGAVSKSGGMHGSTAALARTLINHQLQGSRSTPATQAQRGGATPGELAEHQHTTAAAGAPLSPSVAAVLLDYCLSDLHLPPPTSISPPNPKGPPVSSPSPAKPSHPSTSTLTSDHASILKAVAQLDGLPLLPLANGQLGVLRCEMRDAKQVPTALPPGSRGVQESQQQRQQRQTPNQVQQQQQQQHQQQPPSVYVLPILQADNDVLAPVPGLCLCTHAFTSGLQTKLVALAHQGTVPDGLLDQCSVMPARLYLSRYR